MLKFLCIFVVDNSRTRILYIRSKSKAEPLDKINKVTMTEAIDIQVLDNNEFGKQLPKTIMIKDIPYDINLSFDIFDQCINPAAYYSVGYKDKSGNMILFDETKNRGVVLNVMENTLSGACRKMLDLLKDYKITF